MLIYIAWSLHLRKERWICKNSFLSWHFYRSLQWAKFFAYFLSLGLCQLPYKVNGPDPYICFGPDPYSGFGPNPYSGFGPNPYSGFGPDPYSGFWPNPYSYFGPIGTMVLSPIRKAVLDLICTAIFDPIRTAILGPICTAVLTCIEHKETDKRPKYVKTCLISKFTCDLLIGMLTTGSSGSGLTHLNK